MLRQVKGRGKGIPLHLASELGPVHDYIHFERCMPFVVLDVRRGALLHRESGQGTMLRHKREGQNGQRSEGSEVSEQEPRSITNG